MNILGKMPIASMALHVVLVLVSGVALAQPVPEEEIVSRSGAESLISAVERLIEAIPAASVSSEGLIEECSLEVDCYTDYIKSRIVLAPYRGVLQGTQGVIQTGSGNSLEISLLLKQLLERVGYSVRIAKAKLGGEQTSALLDRIASQDLNLNVLQRELVLDAFKQFAKVSNVSVEVLEKRYESLSQSGSWSESQLFKRAVALSKKLYGKLQDQLPTSLDKAVLARIQDNLSEYYFVQYRLESGTEWKNFYYGFAEAQDLKVESFFDAESNVHHTLTMQAFIKREQNGRTEIKEVSDKMTFRTAELTGADLYYMAAPDNIYDIVESGAADEQLNKVKGFIPMINTKACAGAVGFDLNGNTFPTSQLTLPVGALAGAVGNAGTKALEALKNALPASEEQSSSQQSTSMKSKLLEHFLIIEWSEPNGEVKQYKRVLFDSSRKKAPHPTLTIGQLFTLHSSYAPLRGAVLLKAQLERTLAFLSGIEKANVQASTPLKKVYEILAAPIRKTRDIRFDYVTYLTDSVLSPQEQIVRFGPVIQSLWEVTPSEKLSDSYLAVDVLQDEAVVLRKSEALKYDGAKTFQHGIWLSYAENMAINGISADRTGFKDSISSGVELLERYAEQKSELALGQGDELSFGPAQGDFFALVLNKNTGMPLVLDEAGRGGSFTEYEIMLLKVGYATVKAMIKIALCFGDGSRAKGIACILCEATAGILGILDGGLGIGDVAGFMATEFAGDMVCAVLGRAMD